MATYRLTPSDDTRTGTSDADTFDGYAGDDGLGAAGGTDRLDGAGGNDLFLIDLEAAAPRGTIDGGADTDTVKASGSNLGALSFRNVEVLSLASYELSASIAQFNAFSTITTWYPAQNDRITFYLNGPGGTIDASNRMGPGQAVKFNASDLSSAYDATGTAYDDIFINTKFDDTVHGGGGADLFVSSNWYNPGGGGTDKLYGDAGNDTFYLHRQSGTIDGGRGYDTVQPYVSHTSYHLRSAHLGDASFLNVERLFISDSLDYVYVTLAQLNAFATITGGNADKRMTFVLSGGAGGTIDFSQKIGRPGESVEFRADAATSAVDVTGTARDDTLRGSRFNDTLRGGDGNDYLDGTGGYLNPRAPSGRDTLVGGAGDDTYRVDATDTLIETMTGGAGGSDTVVSLASFDLTSARLQGEFENLTLADGRANLRGYGNARDNTITGDDGNNYLDGRAGADRLIGGYGDDTYVVDDAGDIIVDQGYFYAGMDRVLSSVSFDLGDPSRVTGSVENLTLQGTASIDATGNELDNALIGNSGANVLDGGGGRDIMRGGAGDDTYHIDAVGDRVIEIDEIGIDTVFASVSFNLTGGHVEHLTLTGSAAIKGTGNTLDNTITGNEANNVLNGGLGIDTLTGGGGKDVFLFNTALTPANVDTITDFDVPSDTIRLDDAIFSALSGPGTLKKDEFAWTYDGEATDPNDRIVYDSSSGNLYYDADGDGAGSKLLFATIAPHLAALSNADFAVV